MQLKYQELATELLAKRNEIHRQKDQLCKDKAKAMEEATDRYCEAKRKGQAEIDEIRAEKHRIEFNTPQFHILEDEARSLERKLSMLRSDHEHELHTINNRFAAYDLIQAMDEGRDPVASAAEAGVTMDLINGMYESEFRRERIALPLTDRSSPFR